MTYNVLITTAAGGKSRASAIYALKLAKAVDGKVTAMFVRDSSNYVNNLSCDGPDRKGEEALRWVEEEGYRLGVPVEILFSVGNPADVIAEKTPFFDLLVMGTAGKAGASHFLLGSVTEKVLRNSRCPVIAIRNHDPEKPFKLEKMLIATDGGDHNAIAVSEGIEMAKRTPGMTNVTVLCVKDPKTVYLGQDPADLDEACSKAVRFVEEEGRKAGLKVEKLIMPGQATEVIAETSLKYDMVVMGVKDRKGIKRIRPGVAEKIVRKANRPIMLVRDNLDEDSEGPPPT